jgi:phosphate-selective porin OprO/OprP
MKCTLIVALMALGACMGDANLAAAQSTSSTASQQNGGQGPIDDTMDAGESANDAPARRLVKWNEYEGPWFSIRLGGGYLYDYAAFVQDEESEQQVTVTDQWKMRDGRILLSGRLKFLPDTTWSAGIMYDEARNVWVMRQTGIMFGVPKIWGHIFVGRTKEGFSLNKVMIGYGGWTMERAPINDATLPILADGVKWLGYVPKARLIWNFGVYGDTLSKDQTFSTYSNQVSGRVVWLPKLSADGETLVHLGVSMRYGKPEDGKLRLRARPGAWAAPYYVDTEEFAADSARMTGIEGYYRPGSLTMGGEVFMQRVAAPDAGDPLFHGGEVFMSYLFTGETRTYNTRGGYFNQISPNRPVFSGGPGAWELVTHFTYIDLDSGTLTGGKYWRATPMANWYLSDHVRLEFAYGYGSLSRFSTVGKTHFFQTRLQLQL